MNSREDIDKIKKIADTREQLKKNNELKDHLMITKDSISKETFDKYVKTYTENIEKLQIEVSIMEGIINGIEHSFNERKINIETRMSDLEKVINETTTLYKSNAIDTGEYNKRKSENDLLLSKIGKDNSQLSLEIERFEAVKSSGETTSTKNKASTNKIKFTKKNIIIFSSAFVVLMAILIIFIITKYSDVSFDGWGSDFKKQNPVRVPVVDNTFLYGFTDERGIIVIAPQFQSIRNFTEGFAAVRNGSKWGYINDRGALVIDYQFTSRYANDFSESLVAVYKDKKWGYIDKKGDEIIPFEYDDARSFYLGLAPVEKDKKWGYIDKENNVVIDFQYDDAYSYRGNDDGLAVVRVGNKRGYVDKKGDYVVDPIYDNVKAFADGLAAVKKDGKWGYIDTEGDLSINNQYKNAYNFNDSLSVVETDNRLIIIGDDGDAILSTDYDRLINLGSSVFTGTYDDKFWQLLDNSGGLKISNDNIISPVDIYGNGMIFRTKSPYGYALYDSSFNHVMNYYFPYTGVYKSEGSYSDDEDGQYYLYGEYYFFVWYKESSRKYYCFGIYMNEDAGFFNFLDYSELVVKGGKMTITKENIVTNEIYDFYTDKYTNEISTNQQLHTVSIDSDILTIGEKSFERSYNFENTNNIGDIYSKEKDLYGY